MVRLIDAIFTQGAFRPLAPIALAEGTRVHLSVDEVETSIKSGPTPKIHTPRLAHPEDAAKFVMDVQEIDNARV
jgi:predicted DNA-binding antitoxin AbrB/MazE fold protein